MATVADYIVMSDAEVTLVPNPSTGRPGEHRFSFTLPNAAELSSSRQRALLMFRLRTEAGSINAEIDVNARRQRNLPQIQSPLTRTLHEVVDQSGLRHGSNDLLFRVVGGDSNAKLFVSDVILWFQRDGFGPN